MNATSIISSFALAGIGLSTYLLWRVLMNQTQLAQALKDLGAQLTKASAEINGKIADLEAAIANGGETTQEVNDAVDALKISGKALDDIVPDPATPTP